MRFRRQYPTSRGLCRGVVGVCMVTMTVGVDSVVLLEVVVVMPVVVVVSVEAVVVVVMAGVVALLIGVVVVAEAVAPPT